MKTTDVRFDETICREMIGKMFDKYRCDRPDVTNSVTQLIGMYIGDSIRYNVHEQCICIQLEYRFP